MQKSLIVSREENSEMIGRLMEAYGDSLLRLCTVYLRDFHLAEDALQDTFIKVYRRYPSFRHESSVKTWITRIAMNTCRDYLRRKKPEPLGDDRWLEEIPCEASMDSRLESEQLLKAVLALPPKHREVILLYYYEELTTGEIARMLHMPAPTVSARLRRARMRLQSQLKGWRDHE